MGSLMLHELNNPLGKRTSTDLPMHILNLRRIFSQIAAPYRPARSARSSVSVTVCPDSSLSSLDPELTISTYKGRAILFSHNASNGRVDDDDYLDFFVSDSNRLSLALSSQSRQL